MHLLVVTSVIILIFGEGGIPGTPPPPPPLLPPRISLHKSQYQFQKCCDSGYLPQETAVHVLVHMDDEGSILVNQL